MTGETPKDNDMDGAPPAKEMRFRLITFPHTVEYLEEAAANGTLYEPWPRSLVESLIEPEPPEDDLPPAA